MKVVLAIAAAAPGRSSVLVGRWVFDGTTSVPVTTQAPELSDSNLTMTGLTQAFPGNGVFFVASDWTVGAYAAQHFEWTVSTVLRRRLRRR
jgi:hypothetical protein